MISIHKAMFELGKQGIKKDVIKNLVAKQQAKTRILFIDEFQVTDIADAMILKELVTAIWSKKIFTIMTSNRHPNELYKNGLQRELFMPFVKDIEDKTILLDFEDVQDHRKIKSGSTQFDWWMEYSNISLVNKHFAENLSFNLDT